MKKRFGLMLVACTLAISLAAEAQQTCRSESEIPSSTPSSRFSDHGNGTVTDTRSGLMWAKCAVGKTGTTCASGAAARYTWKGALDFAEVSSHAGYPDWRLPDVKELASIVEQRCVNPAINQDPAVFPNTPASFFWSSSPWTATVSSAWTVYFYYGSSGYALRDKDVVGRDLGIHVRLVRDAGQ